MTFTGKATYSAGAGLPEIAEDVSDIIGIVSPFETPLLAHLGDPRRAAMGTVHEWVEDSLLSNTDAINQTVFTPDETSETSVTVDNGSVFQVGDQIRVDGSKEVMFVTAIALDTLTVVRGYGATTPEMLADNQALTVIGNAALEGSDKPETKFTNRVRKQNYTQIFTAGVEVSGSQLAAQSIGIDDELDFQMQERLRELLRDLENSVINGVAPTANQQGSDTVRRTMAGMMGLIQSNQFVPNFGPMPPGAGFDENLLNEPLLNAAIREIWNNSSGVVDTIVVNGGQKRQINGFIGDTRAYSPSDTNFVDQVSTYASDFGVARVVLSRWVPEDAVLLLDSSRVDVLPLAGRSFHFKRLSSTGDSEVGQVIGEYTLEFRNEQAHGALTGLAMPA